MFNDNQIAILNQELDGNRVKTREKGNINLSYLEGFDVIETANKIFGYGNWSYSITKLEQVSQEQNQNQNFVVCYKAIVNVIVHDNGHLKQIHREDVGTGTGIAKTLADAHEGASKEAVTDALKRALRTLGNQFGLSLYDKTKNHQSANNNKHYNQPQNQPMQNNTPQDYSQLTNLGLTVMHQGQNLVVIGENIFEKKNTIKAHGFRWDGASKTWYKPLAQQAA
ncbi:DNA repair protein Rad52 [Sulfurimonas sp. CVO]|uniref:Rad52/Rad22 family DNA repair protein n=1 Tax=Sulfurimonas sp. CVO TaxID=2283483 RepID=UPI00132F1286|nr:Rad52/Rad22 family DNA repair protein [Sulfurimonas sp. CVO]QHG90778.1 DNA repair protein Rad52 [Sulfurimonas sp. CVO]